MRRAPRGALLLPDVVWPTATKRQPALFHVVTQVRRGRACGCFVKLSQQDCISLALRAPYGTLHVSEASCPNFKPRAHARLTELTSGCCAALPATLNAWQAPQRASRQQSLTTFGIDGRCTSTIFLITLCSRSRCGAREAMTVGCKPTTPSLLLEQSVI